MKRDPRARCEYIIWDESICKRPAEWVDGEGKLLCEYHGIFCREYGFDDDFHKKGTKIINSRGNPYKGGIKKP